MEGVLVNLRDLLNSDKAEEVSTYTVMPIQYLPHILSVLELNVTSVSPDMRNSGNLLISCLTFIPPPPPPPQYFHINWYFIIYIPHILQKFISKKVPCTLTLMLQCFLYTFKKFGFRPNIAKNVILTQKRSFCFFTQSFSNQCQWYNATNNLTIAKKHCSLKRPFLIAAFLYSIFSICVQTVCAILQYSYLLITVLMCELTSLETCCWYWWSVLRIRIRDPVLFWLRDPE